MSDRFINPSGFPENLPREQVIEDALKERFAAVAASFGYTHLETSSVEYLDTLAAKGDVNKEIYTLGRALAEEGGESEADRGLHFDLTVPFARYVAQHQGELSFPYRRYQIQKVWRGERPQKGRFREFYQADVDIVARGELPLAADAEVILVMATILDRFAIGPVTMHINNRAFLTGLLLFVGLPSDHAEAAIMLIDKLDKIGRDEVAKGLSTSCALSQEAIGTLFGFIEEPVPLEHAAAFLAGLPATNETLTKGRDELAAVFAILAAAPPLSQVRFVLDPAIARGLDYYTGTVVETTLDGREQYGSICSGGRYADLASRFTNQTLPGVGLSIGLTRLLSIIKAEDLGSFTEATTTDVVVCLLSEEQLLPSLALASALREAGFKVESNLKPTVGLGKQLGEVEKKGVLYAIVAERDGTFTVFPTGGEKEPVADRETLVARLRR